MKLKIDVNQIRLFFAVTLFLAGSAIAQQPALNDVTVYRDLEYAQYARAGDYPLRLDLYIPNESAKPLPQIVWVHGGGWRSNVQNKKVCPAIPFTKHGYAVASIDYRGSETAKFPAQIEDCKAAIRWLRANAEKYNLDPNEIGVWGRSAGGHLVALLGTTGDLPDWNKFGGNMDQSSRVQAVCDWCGPADLRRAPVITGRERVNLVSEVLGDDVNDLPDPDKAIKASPVTYVAHGDPPFLIMHGDKDQYVPLDQSEQLAKKLKQADVDVTLQILEGADHGFTNQNINKLLESNLLPFFDKYLKKTPQ